MVGMVVSNSILIVEFTHRLEEDGMPLLDAVVSSCRIRLRPILMTSLATIFGLIPMAFKLGTGSEAYAPLARAIIGGLVVSVVVTVFVVPAAYLMVYRRGPADGRSAVMRRAASFVLAIMAAAPAVGAGRPAAVAAATPRRARCRTTRRCSAGQYVAQAGNEITREARSAYFPTVYGSVTGAEAQDGSRIAAGGLNNPIILDRVAAGLSVSQLVTDFGRTSDLVQTASLRARRGAKRDHGSSRCPAARGPRVLQCVANAGDPARRAGHGERAPDGARTRSARWRRATCGRASTSASRRST